MVESNESKQLTIIEQKMDVLINEVSSLRHVVIGNGDSNSLVNQVHELKLTADSARRNRERLERRMNEIADCVGKMEKVGYLDTATINSLATSLSDIKERQKIQATELEAQGVLIAAFRNRVIGIVAVLSLLAGAGAGFVAAAKLLTAVVP